MYVSLYQCEELIVILYLVAETNVPRRLKSAPVQRSSNPIVSTATEILTIPEPRFVLTTVATEPVRVASAKARLNTTIASSNPVQIVRREVKSAQGVRHRDPNKLSQGEIEQIFQRVYGDTIDQPISHVEPTVEIVYKEVPVHHPPPVQIYKRSSSWTEATIPGTIDPKSIEISAIPLNPHYIHRPGVIAIRNREKKVIVRAHSASKNHRRTHHQNKRNEPLRASRSVVPKRRLSLEIDGVKLTYDPKLTLNDRSNNLTKYFLDGRLYLIKDQRYNIVDNIDPTTVDKYNRTIP